jgi:hypothetical protein
MNVAIKIIAGLAAAGGIFAFLRRDSSSTSFILSPRQRVVNAARSQIGSADKAKYWASALPGQNPTGLDWCGAFALWSLHSAGLAKNWLWQIGKGFLLTDKSKLPITTVPQPGDIAYFTKNQHEAVVLSVDSNKKTVELANGNSIGGKVTVSNIPWNSVTAFFSITPLIGV